MSLSIERVTDRDGIHEGIDRWDESVPAFAVADWLVDRAVFAPFDGVTVRCYAAREAGTLRAFAVMKRLGRAVGDYDPTGLAWLSLFAFDPDDPAGASAGRALLDHLADELRGAGASELVFGRGPQNLLAGVPDALPDPFVRVLEDAGFELGGDVFDLQREIAGYALPEAQRETARERPGLDVVRATGREDRILEFLSDQFPGRWRYEAANVCRVPGGPADYWLLTFEGDPVGFVRSNRHDGPYRGPNVNWGHRLGPAHCGVGPLGVHEDYRGRGWGLYMVATVLERLADAGYEHCVVDWTDLPGYYEQLGFERWIRYRAATLDLTQ